MFNMGLYESIINISFVAKICKKYKSSFLIYEVQNFKHNKWPFICKILLFNSAFQQKRGKKENSFKRNFKFYHIWRIYRDIMTGKKLPSIAC